MELIGRPWFVALLSTTACLLASTIAVAFAPPVSESPFSAWWVLAYHDKSVPLVILALPAVLLYVIRNAPLLVRISGGMFAGGVVAQVIAARIWGSVPDYLHIETGIRNFGVIANAADVLILTSLIVLVPFAVAGVLVTGWNAARSIGPPASVKTEPIREQRSDDLPS
jgi:hypothetical protein